MKYYVLALFAIARFESSYAMDQGPRPHNVLAMLPTEVLTRILSFVAENNPDALGDLIKIQQTCKQLAGLLSAETIKQIMALTQEGLNKDLYDAIAKSQSKNLRVLFNMGARWNPGTSILEQTLIHGAENIQYGAITENGLLHVIFVLTELGIDFNTTLKTPIYKGYTKMAAQIFDEIDIAYMENLQILSPLNFAVYQKWSHIAKYFIKHGAKIDSNSLKIATLADDPYIVELLLNYGANPNEGANPPLVNAQSAQVASLLLNAGAKLFINCDRNEDRVFSTLVWQARRTMDPSILIEALKPRYSLVTATAIAFAIMAGATTAYTACTIL